MENGLKEGRLFYSIKEVSEHFDLNQSTLRFWEKEFKQLKTQQAVAADRAASKTQTEALYQQVLDAQKALEDFRRTQTLTAEEGEKLEQLAQMEALPQRRHSAPSPTWPSMVRATSTSSTATFASFAASTP